MKKLNLFSKKSGLLMIILFMLLYVIGCTKQDADPVPESLNANSNEMNSKSDVNSKGLATVTDVICLEGTSNFDVYAPKEGRVVVSPDDMFLIMEATLTQVEGQKYLLATTEYMRTPDGPMLYRKFEFDVKITAGGIAIFSYPKTWLELGEFRDDLLGQLLDHTGCIVYGPGVSKGTLDWKGTFDGVNFQASTHFTGKQVQDPMMPVYAGIDGPVKFEFSMTLSKVNCPENK